MSYRITRFSGAGAVTRADFEKEFAQTTSLEVTDEAGFASRLQAIERTLDDSEAEWKLRVGALQRLRSLAASGVLESSAYNSQRDILGHVLGGAIGDLRSQTCREACITLAYLCACGRQRAVPLCTAAIDRLVTLFGNSAKVMASSAKLSSILQYSPSEVLLQVLCESARTSKSKDIRRACCALLIDAIKSAPSALIEGCSDAIRAALISGLVDADGEARAASRTAFQHLEESYSEIAAAIFAALDDRQQKMLCKTGSKLSSTQSLDNEQRNDREKRTMPVNRFLTQRSRSELHLRQPALNKSAAEKTAHNKSIAEKTTHNKSIVEKVSHTQSRTETSGKTTMYVKSPSKIFAKPQSRSARVPIMASARVPTMAARTPMRSAPEPRPLGHKKAYDTDIVERLSKSMDSLCVTLNESAPSALIEECSERMRVALVLSDPMDADGESRAASRTAFRRSEESYGEMDTTVFASLDDQQREIVSKDESKPSPTRSLYNEQANGVERKTVSASCSFTQQSRSELHSRQAMHSSNAVEKTPRAQQRTETKSETITHMRTPSKFFAKPQPRPARVSIVTAATRTPLCNMQESQLLERRKTSDSEFVERLSKSNATADSLCATLNELLEASRSVNWSIVAKHVVDALKHHAYSVRRKALYLIVQICDLAPETLDAEKVLRNLCETEKVTNATRINATTEFHACCNAVAKLDSETCADTAADLVRDEPKLQAPLRVLRNSLMRIHDAEWMEKRIPKLMPLLVETFRTNATNDRSDVRKRALDCVVVIMLTVGEARVLPYLERLSDTSRQLFLRYYQRGRPATPTEGTDRSRRSP